jgi:hypothetical protein
MVEAQLGQWDFEKRSFFTQEQLEEKGKLDTIDALAIATPVVNMTKNIHLLTILDRDP